jgi:hypothetical protein
MKTQFLIINATLAACILCAGCNQDQKRSSPSQPPPIQQTSNQQLPGRYQIIAGDIDENVVVNGSGGNQLVHTMFKIDTITGQTWRFEDSMVFGNGYTNIEYGWREIKDKDIDTTP